MSRATTIGAILVAAVALVFATIASLNSAASEPLYRLDARFHNLPPTLVRDLIAHPPKRAFFGPSVVCNTATVDSKQIEYCICFGLEACAEAPHFHPDPHAYEEWVCTSPLGVIDDRNTATCRAQRQPMVVVG